MSKILEYGTQAATNYGKSFQTHQTRSWVKPSTVSDPYIQMVRSSVCVENNSLVGHQINKEFVAGLTRDEAISKISNLIEHLKNK